MTYAAKLRDPRWQKRRLEILSRDEFRCTNQNCRCETEELHVHHLYYVKGLEPWEHPDESLTTLCKSCHESTEAAWQEARVLLGQWNPFALNMLMVCAAEIGEMSAMWLLEMSVNYRKQIKESATVTHGEQQ